MIHMEQISLRRDGRSILENVNLHMEKGQNWVILGKNGSGKTTILELLNGYLFPSTGSVEVLGNVYGQCDIREARKRIGYISQSMLEKLNLSDPVWEVVATGEYAFLRFYQDIPQEVQDKAIGMLDKLGVGHVAKQPLGTISQGERKKVMLARSLMTAPDILILDEACSGLDLFEREKFLQGLTEMAGDIHIIYVTHHIEEMIPLFTHVAVIDEGAVLAAGPKREVLTTELLQQVFDVPVRLEWEKDRPWLKVI
ncbi:ABC transporter ATP-binding protein [Paenibacillus sp. y28]|uniref:ABC transporter ATP-binding protein n=1 Tax=Paenibacillus sp. y28 TaxID=3129110 RepID=UPI00301816F6